MKEHTITELKIDQYAFLYLVQCPGEFRGPH